MPRTRGRGQGTLEVANPPALIQKLNLENPSLDVLNAFATLLNANALATEVVVQNCSNEVLIPFLDELPTRFINVQHISTESPNNFTLI